MNLTKKLLFSFAVLLICFSFSSIKAEAAVRTISNTGGNYGDIGTWVEGAVPTSADDVVATATSGQLTVNVASVAKTFILTGYTNTLTFNNTLTVSGTVTLASGMTIAGTSDLIVNTTATLTSNGKTLTGGLQIRGTSQTMTLADDWTVTGTVLLQPGTTGTINGSTIYCNGSLTQANASTSGTTNFVMSGTGTFSTPGILKNNLTFNTSGTITISGGINYNTGTLTYTAGTMVTTSSTLNIAASTTLNTSGMTWVNITISGSSTITLSSNLNASGTFTNSGGVNTMNGNTFNIGGSITITNGTFNGTTNLVLNGTGTWSTGTAGAYVTNNLTINTAGTITVSGNVYYRTGTLTYTAGTMSMGTSTLNIGATTTINTSGMSWANITLTSSSFTLTLTSNLTCTGTATIVNSAATYTVNGNTWFIGGTLSNSAVNTLAGTTVITMNGTGSIGNSITVTSPFTINTAGTITFGATFTYNTGTFTYVAGTVVTTGNTFTVNGTATMNTAGITWNNVTKSTVSTTLTLTSALVGVGTLTLTAGTITASNVNVTFPAFSSSNTNVRVLNMGTGTWTLNGTGTVWDVSTATNLTINASASTIVISDTSTTGKTFAGGALAYNIVTFSGDNITVSGAGTYTKWNINNAGLSNGLILTAGVTQTVTQIFTNGTAGNLAKLVSSSAGSAATISSAGGLISLNYISIKDSTATGTATFYAGANSTNVSGNTGWTFSNAPTNALFLVVGAGGGGGNAPTGNVDAGGGGGAGGFRQGRIAISAGANAVTVGTGGASHTVGQDSVFSTITSKGGGFGATGSGSGGNAAGSGGSGGGSEFNGVAGSGTAGQGNAGGQGSGSGGSGSGGGARTSGNNAVSLVGANGGTGLASDITGTSIMYAGGGAGGGFAAGLSGAGGEGGGGAGGPGTTKTAGVDGTANTGGGGGGAHSTSSGSAVNGGAGGSGIVIIAYKTDGSDGISTASTGGTITTVGAYTIHTFTTSGTFTAVLSSPVVTVQAASSITQTTATLNGNITAVGVGNPTVRGFNYGTTVSYGTDTTENGSFSTGAYTADITGLVCNTLYHVRSYATNSYGTATSADTTFTTGSCDTTPPTADITYSDTDGIVKAGDSLTITATFSEPIADAPIMKIAISGSNTVVATNMTKVDTTHYTYVHTVGAGDGTATVALSIGTDIAGNVVTSAPTSGATFTVDNTAPTNQDTVFPTSTSKLGGGTVTIVSSGTASNSVWFAPSGTTTFTAGATMTTAGGTATSILAPATSGAYKLFVIDAAGNVSTASSATLTVDTAPTMTVQAASSITSFTATLNGTITATGGENITTRGFNYGLTTSYGTDTTENGSFSTGAYTANITGLTCNTTYHVRSYGTNPATTGVSTDTTFTTSACPLTRYWVGGGSSTNWNATSPTNWSYTSGGVNNAPIPTTTSNVFFDVNSGTGISTITTKTINSLDMTGYGGTLVHNSGASLIIKNTNGGDTTFKFSSGMTYTNNGGTLYLYLLSANTLSITTAGKVFKNIEIDDFSTGGTFSLQDDLNMTGGIVLTEGILTTNNKNISTLFFDGIPTSPVTLNLGSSTITLTGTDADMFAYTGNSAVWNVPDHVIDGYSTATVNAGTSTIKFTNASANSKTFNGTQTFGSYNNLWLSGAGTGTFNIKGSNTFNDFKVDTPPHTITFENSKTTTVSSFTVSGTVGNLMTINSDSAGNFATLSQSSGTVSGNYLSIKDSHATGGAVWNALNSTNVSGNTGWNFVAAPSFAMQYYSDSGLTNSLGNNPLIKTGTYYVKISASGALSSAPTVSIDAEGTANDVTNAATTLVSANDYKYTRTISSDASAVGTVIENWSVTGTESTGSITATDVDPTNESTKASYTDTVSPTNQDTVFPSSTSKLGGENVTVVSSGTASNNIWFAPSGTTSFTAGATMTTAGGTATSILTPATSGSYKLFVIDAAGNVSNPSAATLTVSNITTPTLTIQAASAVSDTSATLNGNITATGGADPTIRGFHYGLTTSYGTDTTENGSFSTGAFTADITGLTCNTLYHFQAYATNISGSGTSSDNTFTTGSCVLPTVSTVDSDGSIFINSTSSPQTIKITFSQNITNTPTVSVAPNGGAQTVNNCSDSDAKTFCFNYSIPSSTEATETITISGAQSVAGTMVSDATHVFLIDRIAPVVAEVTPVLNPTMNTTPDYVFSSTQAGTITYGGSCSSSTSSAIVGNNTVTFNALTLGVHSNCTIKVTDSHGNDSSTVNVSTFTVIGPLDHFSIDTVSSPQVAGTPINITITAKDSANNTLTDFTGTVDITSTGALSSGSGTTGTFTAGVLSSYPVTFSNVGSFTITATKTGSSESGTSNSFTVNAGATSSLTLNDPGNMTAGTRLSYTLIRKDANGNLVTNGSDTFYLYTNSGSTSKFYDSATDGNIITSVTIPNDSSSASFWYYDDNEGSWTITASDNSTAPDGSTGVVDSTDSVLVSAVPIVATKFIIFSVSPSSPAVGDNVTVTIKAVDDSNNVDTSYQGDASLQTTGSATGNGLAINVVNGVGTISITDTVAESISLGLGNISGTLNLPSNQSVSFAPGALDHFNIANISSPQTAGQNTSVTVTAKDQYNNTVIGFAGTVDFTTNAGTATPLVSNNFTSGVLTQNVYVSLAGTNKTLTATETSGVHTGTSNTFTVNPGNVYRYVLNDPGNMTAGTRVGYIVTRQDQFGNPVSTGSSTIYLYSSSSGNYKAFYDAGTAGNTINSISISDGNSSANFWYYDELAGVWIISASDNSGAPDGNTGLYDGTNNLTVNSASIVATKFIIEANSTATINNPVVVTVRAVNNNNDTDTLSHGNVTLHVSGSATGAGLVTMVNGVGTITINDSVAQTVTLSLVDTESTGLNVSFTKSITWSDNSVPVVGGGGSNPVVVTKDISFSGFTFPTGLVTLFTIANGAIPVKQDVATSSDGSFDIGFNSDLQGFNQYGLFAVDPDGRFSQAKIYNLKEKTKLNIENLVLSPTAGLLRTSLFKGDFIYVQGYASPGSTIALEVDGVIVDKKTTVSADGSYKVLWNTNTLKYNKHVLRVKQITASGISSDFSPTQVFTLTKYIINATDLNSDGISDIRDSSIFLSLWYNKDNPYRNKIDINHDGKVDLQDLSLFLSTVKK